MKSRRDRHWRITVNYYGRVQGVGFRWQVQQIAKSFVCTGYVKNMTDGSVELLVEGNEDQASHMVDEVNHQMSEYWHKKKTDERAGDAHFSEFIIQQ